VNLVSLSKLKVDVNIIKAEVDNLLELLSRGDTLIGDFPPEAEKKVRKKYGRKARKVDPELETKDIPQAKARKPRKKNAFYGEEPVTPAE